METHKTLIYANFRTRICANRLAKIGALFFLCLHISVNSHLQAKPANWNRRKSQHFIVYYQEVPYGYIDKVISKAERYYSSILEGLGFRRLEFWTWDKRARIYIYPEEKAYQSQTNRPGWSGAVVQVRSRTIKTYINERDFFKRILPHELAHIIFREYVGYKAKLPLWLDEGVACSQEKLQLDQRLSLARASVNDKMFMSVGELSQIDNYTLLSPRLFYAESASLVTFLLRRYGRERFLSFCRRIRDTGSWQNALKRTYGFSDINDFNAAWLRYLKE
jgi:hypothetical protein